MPIAYAKVFFGGDARDERRFNEMVLRRLNADVSITQLGRARSGLYLLTKYAVERGERSKVIMSPYTIPDVVIMVVLAGGEPVFYDFEPNSTFCDFNHLSSLIDDRTACVIVTHYHVNEARLSEISELCRSHGALLFDDCAIAFGGAVDGRPIGALTDASVFSFSSFKLLNFFWGGMITTRDPSIAAFVAETTAIWPRLTLKDYAAQAKTCLKYDIATRPVVFRAVVMPMLRKRAEQTNRSNTLERFRIESTELDVSLTSRPNYAAFAEWARKLEKVDAWLARRRAIARIYHRRLGERMVSSPISDAQFHESCFVNYPVIVNPASRDAICREMLLSGFDIGRNLYPNVHRHLEFVHAAGASENVERLTLSSVYLPTHFGVSESYAEAISIKLAELIS